ncbi:MAG: 23S rRNA (guanosine(2251)-2'-O)-methyltransferase RlmB [Verrucomicrobiales bacterium]|nr:23S rRNA (guanosine(2251)-2'-O)-methyltransferase RlmB [Verrucomicrobiales bacterium]
MSRPKPNPSPNPNRNRTGHSGPARANRHTQGGGIARLDEDDLAVLLESHPDPLLLVLDGVQDPHNLGACLRNCDGAGVVAVITPRNHSCPVTETVVRVSCGAAGHIPVVSVTNLARCMERLREESGVRLVGTSDQATTGLYETDLTGPLAIVMGGEEAGLRRLTTENCDELIRIPMLGEVPCLNVSAATAVCLFEAVRQRGGFLP